jgi:hypothetical protein
MMLCVLVSAVIFTSLKQESKLISDRSAVFDCLAFSIGSIRAKAKRPSQTPEHDGSRCFWRDAARRPVDPSCAGGRATGESGGTAHRYIHAQYRDVEPEVLVNGCK